MWKLLSFRFLGYTSTAEKVSKYGVFLARVFRHSDWIRRDTPFLSVFSSNEAKYGQEKTAYLDNFHTVISWAKLVWSSASQKILESCGFKNLLFLRINSTLFQLILVIKLLKFMVKLVQAYIVYKESMQVFL